jgi:HEAT-like repeat
VRNVYFAVCIAVVRRSPTACLCMLCQLSLVCANMLVLMLANIAYDVHVQQSDNWRQREAAVMAFGAVLEGPDDEKLAPLVRSAMPVLVTLMRDG